MLTKQQKAWARQHDWYYAERPDGKIVVFDRYTKDGVSYEDTIVWEKSFSELRNWAGY